MALVASLAGGIWAAQGSQLFFVSEQTGAIDQISDAGVVSRYATFAGSSDLPEGLALDASGTLYIGNAGQGLLWKLPAGGSLTPFASTGNQIYSYGVVLSGNGNLFAAVTGLQVGQIDKITLAGVVSTFASLPTFAEPFGLAFDSRGNLFATDSSLKVVYEISSSGVVSTFASLPSTAEPTGLAFDGNGNLLVADFGGMIYKITSSEVVSNFVTLPSSYGLKGLAFDGSGNLYVAEQNRNTIGRFSSQGVLSDFASVHAPQFFELIPEPSTVGLFGWGVLVLTARGMGFRGSRPL